MVLKTRLVVSIICVVGYLIFGTTLVYIVGDRVYCNSTVEQKKTSSGSVDGDMELKAISIGDESYDGSGVGSDVQIMNLENIINVDSGSGSGIGSGDGSVMVRRDTNTKTSQEPAETLYCVGGLHGQIMMFGTVVLGLAIMVYRMFPGYKTIYIKRAHIIIHIIALSALVVGLKILFQHEYVADNDSFRFHAYTSWLILVFYVLQIIIALLIFLVFPTKPKFRLFAAPFHDVLGIWLFVSLVACCMSGQRFAQNDYTIANQFLFYFFSYATWIVPLVVIISPYFEWELVGPL